MALDATFSVEGSTAVQAHSVAYGQVVDFQLQSLGGANSISWSIVGTSKSTQAPLTITPSGAPSGVTASCTMPSDPGDGLGRSFLVKLTISDGQNTATAYRVFGAANAAGVIPVTANEENYRNATHGYTDVFNQALNTIFGGAGGGNTQLQYNNGGALDGASGITVVGGETALAFGSNPATTGLIRAGNNVEFLYAKTAGGSNMRVAHVSGGDDLVFGDTTQTNDLYLDIKTGRSLIHRVNGTPEHSWNSTQYDMANNNLVNVGILDHNGSQVGFYGTAPINKQTGVAVTAGGVHAALVNLGLIAA